MSSNAAKELFQHVEVALSIADIPCWSVPDEQDYADSLIYLDHDPETGESTWALVTHPADEPLTPPFDFLSEDIGPVDVGFAADLLSQHLRSWLAERGWQVQLSLHKGQATWRLADCLTFSAGGGDRLDDDYPIGPDELEILVRSVCVVAGKHRRN